MRISQFANERKKPKERIGKLRERDREREGGEREILESRVQWSPFGLVFGIIIGLNLNLVSVSVYLGHASVRS